MTRGMHAKQQAGMAAAATSKTFKVGDAVRWTSQAAGSWKEKVGDVVTIVPAGTCPPAGYGQRGMRDHESYIVHVKPAGRGKGTYYWPLVSKLQRA
jgi:hypothetical protein